ncbi:hypothetical protein KFU94_69340 [Chloroflexi bacterium TSY]|nr:hypothetical protein [Chloroflexi bacterium TSY]
MANQSIPPPYSEEQATAWLAYNMRSHGLTIFQIENLQPAWLVGYKEKAPNLLVTRMLWGGWAGLIGGLLFGLLFGLRSGLLFGLLFGLISGLIGGLIEMTKPIQKLDASLRNRGHSTKTLLIGTIAYGLIFGLIGVPLGVLIFGLISGLIAGLLSGLSDGLSDGLFFGLISGLIGGLVGGLVRTSRITLRESNEHVRTIDSLQWSWQNVRRNARKGLILGLLFGLIFGLIGGLISGLIVGLIFGLLGGRLVGALIVEHPGWIRVWRRNLSHRRSLVWRARCHRAWHDPANHRLAGPCAAQLRPLSRLRSRGVKLFAEGGWWLCLYSSISAGAFCGDCSGKGVCHAN